MYFFHSAEKPPEPFSGWGGPSRDEGRGVGIAGVGVSNVSASNTPVVVRDRGRGRAREELESNGVVGVAAGDAGIWGDRTGDGKTVR